MGPKRVAVISFFIILHFSIISGNYIQNKEYNFPFFFYFIPKILHTINNVTIPSFPAYYVQALNTTDTSSIDKKNDKQIFQAIGKKIDNISEKYVQIIDGPARVIKEIYSNSETIGMAHKGQYYPLLKEDDVWCMILFKNKEGWIARQYVTIVDSPPTLFTYNRQIVFIYSVVFFLICVVLWLVFFLLNKKNQLKKEWFSTNQTQKKILIVSNKATNVQRHLTNTTTVMVDCFEEIGFDVQSAKDSSAAMELITQYQPDAILVDWRLGKDIQSEIEKILSAKSTTSNMFLLFFNIPDVSILQKNTVIPNTHYLGLSFTDRDLFNIITPLMITGEKKQEITKSVETSALQGKVADGGVSEVFQFVEIGKKTGCLLVEDTKPSGIVYFNDGIIIYAATKNNKKEKAVFEILNFNRGQFIFVLGKKPKAPNCSIPTLGILMEWTRVNDEDSRNRLRKT